MSSRHVRLQFLNVLIWFLYLLYWKMTNNNNISNHARGYILREVHNRRPVGNLLRLRKAEYFQTRSVIVFPIVFRTILHLNVYANEWYRYCNSCLFESYCLQYDHRYSRKGWGLRRILSTPYKLFHGKSL